MNTKKKVSLITSFKNLFTTIKQNPLVFLQYCCIAIALWISSSLLEYYFPYKINLATNTLIDQQSNAAKVALLVYIAGRIFAAYCLIVTVCLALSVYQKSSLDSAANFKKALVKFPSMMLLLLVLGCVITLGSLLFIIPGVILWLMYSQSYLLILDQRASGIKQALSMSKQCTQGAKWSLLLCYLGLSCISFIGMLIGIVLSALYTLLAGTAYTCVYVWFIGILYVLLFIAVFILIVIDLYHQSLEQTPLLFNYNNMQ